MKFKKTIFTLLLVYSNARANPTAVEALGQCQITKSTVLKSKELKKESVVHTNEVINFTKYSGSSSSKYSDNLIRFTNENYIGFSCNDRTPCPLLGYRNIQISQYRGLAPTGEHELVASVKANDSNNLDISYDVGETSIKLTYDYQKRIGKIEFKEKIRGWGPPLGFWESVKNDLFVLEIKDCNFEGTINLAPLKN